MKKLLILALTLCLAIALCACGGTEGESSNSDAPAESSQEAPQSSDTSAESSQEESAQPAAFTVTVVDQDGNPVKGAFIQICQESCIFKESDENGIVTFDNEITEGYKLTVLACPDGYTTENTDYTGDVYLDAGITEYTVEIIKG